jgi:xanthine dehydrogenase accessory factor
MRQILDALADWQQQGEEIALATLIDTHGPSPRAAGARFFLTRTGKMLGSVSGGCIEGDIFERAMSVLDSGQPIVQRYGIDDELSLAIGLSCGGEIDILIECFRWDETWRRVEGALRNSESIVFGVGLMPEKIRGQRLAIAEGGECTGQFEAVLEENILPSALSLLRAGGQRTLDFDLDGTEYRFFLQALIPQPRLFIVGATHIAMPLARMARLLDFHVSVVDPRGPFATRERFPDADELILEWPHRALGAADLDENCSVLTLTHDLKFDIPALAEALRSEVRYIGALGSRRTHEKRKARLREEGFSDPAIARIHTPIGLDLGARSPEEIALAILAEIVARRRGGSTQPLVEKKDDDAPRNDEED